MSETRHKNIVWTLPVQSNGFISNSDAHLAVLMDLRDELQRLNTLLHCGNFMAIPRKLDRISSNTAKPKKRKKK